MYILVTYTSIYNIYTRPMSVQAENSRSCSFLSSLGYNCSLVIWTVCLTATKFNPLVLYFSSLTTCVLNTRYSDIFLLKKTLFIPLWEKKVVKTSLVHSTCVGTVPSISHVPPYRCQVLPSSRTPPQVKNCCARWSYLILWCKTDFE
jgi:hypothetical protein